MSMLRSFIGRVSNLTTAHSASVKSRQLLVNRRLCSATAMSSLSDYKVEHDEQNKEFFILIGTDKAKLQYELHGDVYDLTHTFTPPALRGRGIAKVLAHKAFDHVVDSRAKMKLTCTYLEYLNSKEQNPKYTSSVVANL